MTRHDTLFGKAQLRKVIINQLTLQFQSLQVFLSLDFLSISHLKIQIYPIVSPRSTFRLLKSRAPHTRSHRRKTLCSFVWFAFYFVCHKHPLAVAPKVKRWGNPVRNFPHKSTTCWWESLCLWGALQQAMWWQCICQNVISHH
jgi:hypothetical protein